ncbi:MAG: hypothetical protein H7A51_02695 [Akkermansiaceae bacterium]|nr:hypothetical protein [Akkermansiaceae bacterium]
MACFIRVHPVIDVLRQNPAVLDVELCPSPQTSMSFYSAPDSSQANDWDYEEFVHGPAGEWIKIRIRLRD